MSQYDFLNFQKELKKVEQWLENEYLKTRTGQASPSVLDGIRVDSYSSLQPIRNFASISIEDPKTLRISPWDKSQAKEIEKAIVASNLGLSVLIDDAGLRVIFPTLTTESRTALSKVLKEKLEQARISVKKEREKVWNDIQAKEKNKEMSEDEKFRNKDALQKLVDESNKMLDKLFTAKEKEIMG